MTVKFDHYAQRLHDSLIKHADIQFEKELKTFLFPKLQHLTTCFDYPN